jgi:nitroreductase
LSPHLSIVDGINTAWEGGRDVVDVVEAIKTRRSIRKFREDIVPDELLRKIVDAATWAPSGDNAQPWVFIIIRDRQLKENIRSFLVDRALRYAESVEGKKELEKYESEFRFKWIEGIKSGRYQEHVGKAPVLIAIFGDSSSPYYIHDCCVAAQNLILAAHAFGLGSCLIDPGIGDEVTGSHIRSLLKAPENFRVVFLVTIGFPAETPKPRPRKDLGEILFLNEYRMR